MFRKLSLRAFGFLPCALAFATACADVPEQAPDEMQVLEAQLADKTESGTWQAYGTRNPISSGQGSWTCGPTEPKGIIEPDGKVVAQLCTVRLREGRVRAAVIVRNNRSSLYGAEVAMTLNDFDVNDGEYVVGRWVCPRSGIAPNSWSVCFGRTFSWPRGIWAGAGGVNGQSLAPSPSN